ncbi:MAG TPA: MFS transporter, partial [Pseudonocardiaceae bacterium]|nr:MFS transporter [Pseudonocardiaceae bacterium]
GQDRAVPLSRRLSRPGGLLRHHDFRHLWLADALSQFGTRISFLALPLAAVSYLHASTLQVSVLNTAQTLAYLLLGLQAGAWCDRMRKRPVLVAADLGRAALFAWVPAGAALGVLTVWQLYVVVAAAGVLTVFFGVAHTAYLPAIVERGDLVGANTKLALNQSGAAIAAPAVGGLLVQWLTAPVAIAVDAASYLWSALWLRGIHADEPVPDRPARANLAREIGEGLKLVFGDPILRAMNGHTACLSLFQSANTAIIMVFLVRVVGLSPGVIGLLSTLGLLGAILASLATGRVAARVGNARLLWLAGLLGGAGFLLNPLTYPGWRLVFEVAATFCSSIMIIVLNIVETSYQQSVTPKNLLGRVNATTNFLIWGVIPVGSLAGGVTATAIGVRPTLWLCGAGALASAAWLVCSPLRRLRTLPTGVAHATAPAGHA